jgi:hypothetical protein
MILVARPARLDLLSIFDEHDARLGGMHVAFGSLDQPW